MYFKDGFPRLLYFNWEDTGLYIKVDMPHRCQDCFCEQWPKLKSLT